MYSSGFAHQQQNRPLCRRHPKSNPVSSLGVALKGRCSCTQGLDPHAVEAVERAARQIAGHARDHEGARAATPAEADVALGRCVLAGFPDRVGKRRRAGSRDVVLATGGAVQAPEGKDELMVVVDAAERAPASGRGAPQVAVRLACAIEPEWLLEMPAPSALRDVDHVLWNADAERVDRVRGLFYGNISLDETREPASSGPETTRLLAQAALAAGVAQFAAPGALDRLSVRIAMIRQHHPAADTALLDLPGVGENAFHAALTAACDGRRGFAELREAGLDALFLAGLSAEARRILQTEAPERTTLPGGRTIPIHYHPDTPPWIESRLQDFFGMKATPTICAGRLPLTLHLLAPNGRAVQVTRDLESFWRQHYPALRSQLGRRYPRHAWPEDGRTATPPPSPGPRSPGRRP